jgi:hypothetical protein
MRRLLRAPTHSWACAISSDSADSVILGSGSGTNVKEATIAALKKCVEKATVASCFAEWTACFKK